MPGGYFGPNSAPYALLGERHFLDWITEDDPLARPIHRHESVAIEAVEAVEKNTNWPRVTARESN